MTDEKRRKLWSRYPKVRELFEEYNSIRTEDEDSWSRLTKECENIRAEYVAEIEEVLSDAAYQLDVLAKRRRR